MYIFRRVSNDKQPEPSLAILAFNKDIHWTAALGSAPHVDSSYLLSPSKPKTATELQIILGLHCPRFIGSFVFHIAEKDNQKEM